MTSEAVVLSDALDGYLLNLRSRNVSPRTVGRYTRVLRGFTAYLTRRGMSTVDDLKASLARASILKRLC